MINNKKKNNKKIVVGLFILFICLLSLTIYTSFSSNLDVQEVIVKSITPVYDETSTIKVDNNNVVFNDKNQTVEYKVVIENTQNYDVKITDIKLSTPTEEFLRYKVEGINKDDVLGASSTKELTISFETMRIDGWGRNFADELTANISFDKLSKVEETPSVPEEDNNADDESTNDDTTSGEEDSTDKEEDKTSDDANKEDKVTEEIPSDKEESENNIVTKPNTESNNKTEDDEEKIENPYTSDKKLVGILGIATCITGVAIIIVSKNKFAKYTVLIVMLSSTLTLVNAEEKIELPVRFNVGFKSQNVMKSSGLAYDACQGAFLNELYGDDYWGYAMQIKNIYIQNEITEIDESAYEFDVTEEQNGRVMAYLVEKDDNYVCYNLDWEEDVCYDLYLQADGIIYPNKDASYYFAAMRDLDNIDNMSGIDTSEVTSMRGMFNGAGDNSEGFILDVSDFDTSNVTDMSTMFMYAGHISPDFSLDLSNFNTGNVTDMSGMFVETAYESETFTLDVSNFDTSKVTDMSNMFKSVGRSSTKLNLDVSNFDTSKVTDMSYMFSYAGQSSETCSLNVSNIDFSNAENIGYMFAGTCVNADNQSVELTIKDHNMVAYSVFEDAKIQDGTQIIVNYTNKTKGIANRIVDSKGEDANVVLGEMVEVIEDDELSIGDEVEINGEYFNVLSIDDDTISLLPQYNLGTDYRQSSVRNGVKFANAKGWEYTPGPKEIDIQTWSTNPKTYVNAYVEYLKEELGDDTVTGDLITLKDLESLGCTVPADYAWGSGGWNCYDSPYGWLANGQFWLTRSASSTSAYDAWNVHYNGYLFNDDCDYNGGVRPVITISKSSI